MDFAETKGRARLADDEQRQSFALYATADERKSGRAWSRRGARSRQRRRGET